MPCRLEWPLWREHFCSLERYWERDSGNWLWREGETPSDRKLLTPVVCGGGFGSV